ncbi:hypothetical protein Poli38472_009933 [Pythium oligandrum]|uniref:Phospholipid-transporting ATPase n=1 Tax=Pythium oligandrum TaxID=41045 RepID=A0A8K1C812_PYTOL|nr:hypothetical protein Poli38472_009933 [Pythium oligandrum]|eukprot:TMW58374.1 hypothetical protein Poli38472_009933 [Pythium oligandrum]
MTTPRAQDAPQTPSDADRSEYVRLEEGGRRSEAVPRSDGAFSSATTASSAASSGIPRSNERLAYFHRNQTVEVLPRSHSSHQPALKTDKTDSELFRTFTSSAPLSGRLRQRLLDNDSMDPPATPRTTRAAVNRSPQLRRLPSVGAGLPRTSSWHVFYRNLPRTLRFRLNTRSTTRYIDPSNAASLRDRLRAQREEVARFLREPEEEFQTDMTSDTFPPAPTLQRERSNFEDASKYLDHPAVSTPSSGMHGPSTPGMSLISRSFTADRQTDQESSNNRGRASSMFSVDSAGPNQPSYRIVKINPDERLERLLPPTNAAEDGNGTGEVIFPPNEVKTSKYSWWSFVPVFLYLTFQKTANLYFLLIGIFQMIPDISPTDGVPLQFLPLAIVTIIDAFFAGYEDYKRHLADDQANSAPTRHFNRELREFEDVQWRDLQVGDFVKILNHETIPADVLILSVVPAEGSRTGGNSGVCYVETKNLDGETNLKLREAPRLTRHMFDSEEEVGEVVQGYLESEMPNGDINRYSGTLYIDQTESLLETTPNDQEAGSIGIPITLKNMLLRGSKLRNTKCAYGLVVNTGVDSKIMMSSGDEFPVKISSIDEMTNKQVIIVVFLLAVMSLIGAIGDHQWLGQVNLPPEVDPSDIPKSIIGTFVYFFTTLASIVPITLYVSITMVKALQAYFMEHDLDMYDAESDIPMVVRNMQLNEQLGQISHIFSDKTGTLTCNKMEFRKCSIHGVSYGKGTTAIGLAARMRDDYKGNPTDDSDDESTDVDDEIMACPAPNVNFRDRGLWQAMKAGDERTTQIRDFFRHLALCHGVLIEHLDAQPDDMEHPPIIYSASSPDEQALVSGAKYFGFEFVNREPGSVSVKTPEGVIEQYEVLEVFEFDSTRKRMTVVVHKRKTDEELMQMSEDDDEEVLVLTKGADSVLFPRLNESPANVAIKETTVEHLESFARDGLRTLVICSKVLPMREWEEFHLRYRRACSDLQEVEAKSRGEPNIIDNLEEEMEQNLMLLGATAIEDRLQDGVPEAMEQLARAGISIWVLTGDMEETAINIGYACRLLNNDMQRHVINSSRYRTKGQILRQLDKIFHEIYEHKSPSSSDEDDDGVSSSLPLDAEHALVIDGASLTLVLADPLYNLHLLRVALLCKVVVACRVSPQQKAQLVELVKLNVPDSHTLSIGDGANDVPMIQSAHIGIGISGQEGMQAVNSSDYALGQFRFLSTLLLTHGRWNYNRISALVVYTFYKNVVYNVSMFWYCLSPSAYSGTMIYSALIQQGYNLIFTALPIMAYSVLDRDVPKSVCLEYPALYHPATRARSLFSYTMFWKWIFLAFIDSVGVYFAILATAYNVMRDGESVEYTVLQSVGWTMLCVVVNVRFCLMVNSWDVIEAAGIIITIVMLYLFQYIVDLISWTTPDYNTYSFPWIFGRWIFWLGPLLAVIGIFAKNIFYEGVRRRFFPDYMDLVKEKLYVTTEEDPESKDDLKKYSPPAPSYLSPELMTMLDYRDRREQERAPVRFTAPGRSHLYHGFAFDRPAYVVGWMLANGGPSANGNANGPSRRKSMNPDVRKRILSSDDPVIFENERYQPFFGFGSTYPGYLLPTDRNRWSNRSGKLSAMSIPLAGLELNMDVPGCDDEGWVYEKDFKFFPSVPPVKPGEDDETEEEGRKSRPSSKRGKKVTVLRGFVRRREWVLSEKYKQLAREREERILAASELLQKEGEDLDALCQDDLRASTLSSKRRVCL